MKIFPFLKKSWLVFAFFLFVSNVNAQQWHKNLPQKAEANYTFYDYQNAFNEYWESYNVLGGCVVDEDGNRRKASGWKQFKRQEQYWKKRVNAITGEFPKVTAWEQYEKWKKENSQNTESATGNWSSVGPANTDMTGRGTGRINCMTFDPSDNNHYWVGAPAGGVWETTDGGTSWTCLTDANPILGVSDIAIPADYNINTNPVIYIATGDRDAVDDPSIGILKSTDGGATWNTTGLTFSASANTRASSIICDPNDVILLLQQQLLVFINQLTVETIGL